jgi:hypothetical protein
MATPVLTTSRYIQPGVYIGEIINPGSTNLTADARLPAIVAKGSTYAQANNVPIVRAFVPGEELTFSSVTPFIAPLRYPSNGYQQLPVQIYTSQGIQLQVQQWKFITDIDGVIRSVQIADATFEQSSTYFIDYQSTDRNVKDPIPLANIRQIQAVGNQLGLNQYQEYINYFIPDTFSSVTSDANNVHTAGFFDGVVPILQAGSTGSASVTTGAEYTNDYTRSYTLICLAVAGAIGTRTATFQWQAINSTGGNALSPPVPLASTDVFPTFLLQETNPPSMTQTLEFGTQLTFSFGSANFVVSDTFTLRANGPSLVEVDDRYNSPQYAHISTPVPLSGNPGNLQLEVDQNAAYTGHRNNSLRIKLLSITGVSPTRVMNFCWARYGDVLGASGSFTVSENIFSSLTQTIVNGVILDFVIGVTSPAAGTIWNSSLQAPRIYYTAKDSRNYTLNVSTVIQSGTLTSITGSFTTDTSEGNFGTFQTAFDSASTTLGDGYALMPDTISVGFRNMLQSFAPLDIFTFGVVDDQVFDWSLTANAQDLRQVTDLLTDYNGSVTGTAGNTYVILQNVPIDSASIRVQNYNTGADISYSWVTNTQYIFFTTKPTYPILISYKFAAAEPAPGQTYYLTCLFQRPQEFYNNPFLVLRQVDGRAFAAPVSVTNDLYIGDEILWQNGATGCYLVQPYNQDGSGVYSVPDFQAAITSMDDFPRITDVCLLNFPDALPYVLQQNLQANDPFQKRPNLVWYGAPIGTPIGDVNTPGTLVFTALNTLQAPGSSNAKGTRIMVAPTRATLTLTLTNGVSTTVTVDGSFVALAAASRVAGFSDPATDLLKQPVVGFDTIQIYPNSDISQLGQAQIVYVNGAPGSYSWGEDTTVDHSSGFNLIQLMTQRQFVTKVVIREMESLIGITPNSSSAAKQLIQGQLASVLLGLLARGLIAPYQDEVGAERPFNPDTDILIFQDQNDPTLFYFLYAWFSRNVIKRLFGLYDLNSNNFSTGIAASG